VRTTCRRIERRSLTNARVLRFDIAYAVERLFSDGCVNAFHVMFPDPWPKRRHASRRLVTRIFLASLHRALIGEGTVRIATDDSEYFRQINQLVAECPLFAVISNETATAVSKFEKQFTDRGVPIHRLGLRKVSPPT
jgi:tRNA (guanine-N7-)-methyltransferase